MPDPRDPADVYPFSESDSIALVSYESRFFRLNDADTVRARSINGHDLIADGQFIVPDIQQRLTLDTPQRDSLFGIFYDLTTDSDEYAQADCYDPHHAVVFYKGAKAIAFFEICFSCGGTLSSPGVDFGTFCDEKKCALARFFKKNKVDFGFIEVQYAYECLTTTLR